MTRDERHGVVLGAVCLVLGSALLIGLVRNLMEVWQ
jgi:hypothetical protein